MFVSGSFHFVCFSNTPYSGLQPPGGGGMPYLSPPNSTPSMPGTYGAPGTAGFGGMAPPNPYGVTQYPNPAPTFGSNIPYTPYYAAQNGQNNNSPSMGSSMMNPYSPPSHPSPTTSPAAPPYMSMNNGNSGAMPPPYSTNTPPVNTQTSTGPSLLFSPSLIFSMPHPPHSALALATQKREEAAVRELENSLRRKIENLVMERISSRQSRLTKDLEDTQRENDTLNGPPRALHY